MTDGPCNFNVGDVVLVELGVFNGNRTMTRLVKVRVDMLSHDRIKAVVTMLPLDPQKKNVIQAERYAAGKSSIIRACDLFRSESDHCQGIGEFNVGDAIAAASPAYGEGFILGTVTKTKKNSVDIMTTEGKNLVLPHDNVMVISPANRK